MEEAVDVAVPPDKAEAGGKGGPRRSPAATAT